MQVAESLCSLVSRRVLQPRAGSALRVAPPERRRARVKRSQSTSYLQNKLWTATHAASPVHRRLNDPDTWCPGRGPGCGRGGRDAELVSFSFLCSFLFLNTHPALPFPVPRRLSSASFPCSIFLAVTLRGVLCLADLPQQLPPPHYSCTWNQYNRLELRQNK